MDNIDILVFDIKGKFAHFRKFYTNSSALSYSIPPRTTIEGLIAAILGFERDSYYEIFSKNDAYITIRKMGKTRKIMQSLNYIKATSMGSLVSLKEGHTQIPFEIVTSDKNLCYRVYISCKNKEIVDELEYRIINRKYVFSPYLGVASFNCSLQLVERVIGKKIQNSIPLWIATPLNEKFIKKIDFDLKNNQLLLKEKMPSEIFKNRVIGEVASYIYDDNGTNIKALLNCNVYNLKYKNIDENIVFM